MATCGLADSTLALATSWAALAASSAVARSCLASLIASSRFFRAVATSSVAAVGSLASLSSANCALATFASFDTGDVSINVSLTVQSVVFPDASIAVTVTVAVPPPLAFNRLSTVS